MNLRNGILLLTLCFSITNTIDYSDPKIQNKYNTYISILVMPIIASASNFLRNYLHDPMSNTFIPSVDARVAEIIRARLTQAGVKNASNIEIKRLYMDGISDNAFAWIKGLNDYRIVLTTKNNLHEFEILALNYLDAVESQDEQKIKDATCALDEALAIIDHEAQHIIHDDVKGRFLIQCTIHGALFGVCELLQSKPIPERSTANIVISALSQVILGSYLSACYSRYIESRADNGVQNNSASLNGAIHFFNKNYKDIETSIATALSNNAHRSPFVQKLIQVLIKFHYYGPFCSHPHPLKRVQKFQDRLDQLSVQTA